VQECEDFNTIDAFRFFDREGRGEISIQTLQGVLMMEISRFGPRGRNLQISEQDLISFIKRYSESPTNGGDYKIRYSDFCNAVAPKDKFYLNTLAQRAPRNLTL